LAPIGAENTVPPVESFTLKVAPVSTTLAIRKARFIAVAG
jgi:hypothetical protein